MREVYSNVLKRFFQKNLCQSRKALGISQEEMAHRLSMAPRSYLEMEHGKTCCSGLTLARYLIYVCHDPMKFLEELRSEFENSVA